MQWLRLYDEVLDDPKVQQLTPAMFKHWINLLCLANKGTPRGTLPSINSIAFRLRMSEQKAESIVNDFLALGLIELQESVMIPHNWGTRQRASDDVAERVRKHRKGGDVTLQATLPETPKKQSRVTDTDTDTDTDTEPLTGDTPLPPTGEKRTRRTSTVKSVVPDDYEPTPEMVAAMVAETGLDEKQIRTETASFRDYHRSKGNRFADLPAAWRSWMRSPYRKQQPRAVTAEPARGESRYDDIFAKLRAERDAKQRQEPSNVIDVSFVARGD